MGGIIFKISYYKIAIEKRQKETNCKEKIENIY